MEYYTTVEMSKKWGITSKRIDTLCAKGRIEGVIKKGKTWLIPSDALRPADARYKNKDSEVAGMIYVYTDTKEQKDFILSNDQYFNLYTSNKPMGENEKNAILEIDHAKVTDDNHIETKYGVGVLRNLSSGCKTYLNAVLNPEKIVSVTECGANVLSRLFLIDGIRLYMDFPQTFEIADGIQICFNDRDIVTGRNGFEQWWSKEYARREEDDL